MVGLPETLYFRSKMDEYAGKLDVERCNRELKNVVNTQMILAGQTPPNFALIGGMDARRVQSIIDDDTPILSRDEFTNLALLTATPLNQLFELPPEMHCNYAVQRCLSRWDN